MNLEKIRKEIHNMKIHLDHINECTFQANNMIYSIEEQICGLQENESLIPIENLKWFDDLMESMSNKY
jgi:hypothetical protein